LSIVDKTVRRMGGKFHVSNARTGGFLARLELTKAPAGDGTEKAPAVNGSEKRSWPWRPAAAARRALQKAALPK
jgi:hypothetical protein